MIDLEKQLKVEKLIKRKNIKQMRYFYKLLSDIARDASYTWHKKDVNEIYMAILVIINNIENLKGNIERSTDNIKEIKNNIKKR